MRRNTLQDLVNIPVPGLVEEHYDVVVCLVEMG